MSNEPSVFPEYGARELRRNYPWYLCTAIALVCGLSLNASLLPAWYAEWTAIPYVKKEIVMPPTHVWYCGDGDLNRSPTQGPPIIACQFGSPENPFQIPTPVPSQYLPLDSPETVPTLPDQWIIPFLEEEPIPAVGKDGYPIIDHFYFVESEPVPLNLGEVNQLIKIPGDFCFEGYVVARILVDEEGNYVRHVILNGIHPLISQEVEKHLHLLRFEPALDDNDKPIAFWVNLPFSRRFFR